MYISDSAVFENWHIIVDTNPDHDARLPRVSMLELQPRSQNELTGIKATLATAVDKDSTIIVDLLVKTTIVFTGKSPIHSVQHEFSVPSNTSENPSQVREVVDKIVETTKGFVDDQIVDSDDAFTGYSKGCSELSQLFQAAAEKANRFEAGQEDCATVLKTVASVMNE
jgi:hypothetical protein